jgi:hypothetical protein
MLARVRGETVDASMQVPFGAFYARRCGYFFIAALSLAESRCWHEFSRRRKLAFPARGANARQSRQCITRRDEAAYLFDRGFVRRSAVVDFFFQCACGQK